MAKEETVALLNQTTDRWLNHFDKPNCNFDPLFYNSLRLKIYI